MTIQQLSRLIRFAEEHLADHLAEQEHFIYKNVMEYMKGKK